jgi:hypothetical protein
MNAFPRLAVVFGLAGLVWASRAAAEEADEQAFYKACFLQSEERDFAAAATLFARVAEADEAAAEIRDSARRRLAECREELAAADLASLMPAESMAYVQFANIGSQARLVLESLGLAGDLSNPRAGGPRIPIEEGLSFPLDFAVSPALVREIGKLGGVAAALTSIDERGVPAGVVIVHLGDSDLVRGLVETGMQVVTPNEPISDYATYRIPVEGMSIWLVRTERLLVLSLSREQIVEVVSRLKAERRSPSLSDSPPFRVVAEARENSLVFAWADAQRAAPLVDAAMQREMRAEELMAARAVLNLPQIECATLSLGAFDGGLRGAAAVRFKPGHQHLIYGLLRTAPIGQDALKHVPAGAAAVVAIGLNPPSTGGSASRDEGAPPQIALMDLGREFFANIQSATVFAMPSAGPLPEVGVAVRAQDAEKSHQLWSQLIGMPARFGFAPPEAAGEATIGGRAATRYAYPGAPEVYMTQPSDGSLVIGTAGAVEASLAAAEAGDSEAQESDGDGMSSLLAAAGPTTSKAVFLRVGPLTQIAARQARGREQQELTAIAAMLDDATVSLTVDEDPNELRVQVALAGAPKVAEILRAIQQSQGGGPMPPAFADSPVEESIR